MHHTLSLIHSLLIGREYGPYFSIYARISEAPPLLNYASPPTPHGAYPAFIFKIATLITLNGAQPFT